MALNPFAPVSDYSNMLMKIAASTFIVSLIEIIILQSQIPQIPKFLHNLHIPTTITIVGISIPFYIIIPAILIAVISRIIKLHDRISDIFKIREDFDIHNILMPLALGVGANLDGSKIEQLPAKRRTLMNEVFYEYASTTRSKPAINPHYITMALDQWKWYWILIEATVITFIASVIFFFFRNYLFSFIFLFIVILALGLLKISIRSCAHHAQEEVEQIISDIDRKNKILEVFNAL